MPLNVV